MNSAIPTQQAFCYNCHAPLVSPGTAFCDTCGAPQKSFTALSETLRTQSSQVRSLEEQKNILGNQIQELMESETKRNITLQTLESKRAELLAEVKEFENKKLELTNEVEGLTSQIQQLENSLETTKSTQLTELESLESKRRALAEVMKSEEATIEVLRREKLELEHQVKPRVKKNSRPHKTQHKKKTHGVEQETHTFIGKYEGKEDWNAELAKRIAQFGLSLDHTTYSVSPEKIVFSVTGSRGNIEELAATLNGLEGFVNLRSRLAETRRSLREVIDARNARQEQLDAVNKAPWYRSGTTKSLTTQKAELNQELAADELKIKALTEAMKAIENLLGSEETKSGAFGRS